MSFLLDVNVLVALLDEEHVFHDRAEDWLEAHASLGWATCPHTENGAVRVLGNHRYPGGAGTPAAAADLLRGLLGYHGHQFWVDEVSILASPLVDTRRLGSSAQVTDTYLLALAILHGGKLATFDRRLSVTAVSGGLGALHVIE